MNTVALEKFAVSAGGSVDPSKYPAEEFDLYSIPAYDKYEPEVAQGSEIGSTKKTVQPGDVLLSRIVPHIRRVWVVGPSHGRRQIGSGEWIIFRGDSFDSNYLRHMLMADPFHKQFMQTVAGVGGSLLRARPSEVEKIKIPLPSLPEQKRIAAILDKADAIRRKRQQAVKLTEELLRSVFLDMFGDPVTNPKGWEEVTIRDLVSEVKYGTSDKASYEGKYPVLRMNNINYLGGWNFTDLKRIDIPEKELSKYLVRKGDILFNRTNSKELVGKTAVYRRDDLMAYAGYLIRIRPNKHNNSEYIAAYLNSTHGKKTLESMCKNIVGMANINAQELQEIPILRPPLGLQNQYAELVHSVERAKEKLITSSEVTGSLFNSLLQRAFKGGL